jgi:hypothetical protein
MPVIKGANVGLIADRLPNIPVTPFGMGIMGINDGHNPGKVLAQCADGKVAGRYEGIEKLDGTDLLCFSRGDGDAYRFRYYFDPKRGFQPVQIWGKGARDQKWEYKAFVSSYRSCSRDRWFPDRGVVVWNPDEEEAGQFSVNEVVVRRLEVDKPPPDSEFYLDIAAGTQISDPTVSPGYVNVTRDETIRLNDLEPLRDKCRMSRGPTAADAVKASRWPHGRIVAASVLAILAVAVLYLLRRRSAGKAP